MRSSALLYFVPLVVCTAASPSPADVTISNAATANMTCSGGVCAPTAADAVLNVQSLEAMLASGPATVKTTGAGVQAKDIQVKAPLTWSAATTLALDAYRSIDVNARVSVPGTGGVSLTTNDGGSGGDFVCNDNGRVQFSNLSSTLSINGTSYVLVNSVASLASAIATNPGGAFALARTYNAKGDGIYTSSPITTIFTGSFNGLGNAISSLSINDPTEGDHVGLFAETSGTIANARLVNERVRGAPSGPNGNTTVGGLVADAGGMIAYSFSTGIVRGGEGATVGGLVGTGYVVRGSGSAATVVSGGPAGGLMGTTFSGSVRDSRATGNVSGVQFAGGLVAFEQNTAIDQSWASGQVLGSGAAAGGLVGIDQYGSIERSHATGAVSCSEACGGLVGWAGNDGSPGPRISQSYATGNVTGVPTGHWYCGTGIAGGLVGWKELGRISNSYAWGRVTSQCAGGLVGWNDSDFENHQSISQSYATGAVVASETGINIGGLIGADHDSSLARHAYWDMTTSGISNPSRGAGNIANDPGIRGVTNKKFLSGLPKGFSPKIWKEDSNINDGLPYLINNPPAN